jgi:hypothetical protein
MEDTIINPKCTACKCYWKPDETDVKTSGLVYNTCKRCRDISKANNKKYRELNPDKVKQQCQKYYQGNTDKVKQQQQKYRQDNADKVKQQQQKYYQENKCEHNKGFGRCSQCNPLLYLLNIQRRHLRRCLKIGNLDKTKPTIAFLGCDAVYFKDYIQKKMDNYNETAEIKMDFSNIHIDHIKPVSSFNLDEEDDFLDCCNYTNLQPLLIQDNLRKKNKWTDEDEAYWNDNIKGKEYFDIYL